MVNKSYSVPKSGPECNKHSHRAIKITGTLMPDDA